MSDFLSNFDKNKYKETVTEKKEKKERVKSVESDGEAKQKETEKKSRPIKNDQHPSEQQNEVDKPVVADVNQGLMRDKTQGEQRPKRDDEDHTGEEETEIDLTYRKRQQRKIMVFTMAGVISAIVFFFIYYAMTHVTLATFTGKPISEARSWAADNNVKLDIEQAYDFEQEVNTVVKQGTKAGKKVKKKSTIKLTTSLGPNPEDVLPLPDFTTLSKSAADEWVIEHKAENLSIIEEYSDTIEKGKFTRQEINNKDITPATYKREDQAVVYFSKGKEVFEKNVAVPDFDKKTKADVEAWVKTNEIKMEYKALDSDKVEEGVIISQSIAKGTKIAKRDEMSVEVSTGKAFTVPNFGELTPESAATVEGLKVAVKTTFSWNIPYGNLIGQSIPAGEKVKEKDVTTITVTYSAGKPYLRSYFGQLEGDLDKLFFDDYRSKGANIKFTTYYVDSDEERGKVVGMNAYNQYIPLNCTVSIAISNGSRAARPTNSPVVGENGSNPEPKDEPEEDEKTEDN